LLPSDARLVAVDAYSMGALPCGSSRGTRRGRHRRGIRQRGFFASLLDISFTSCVTTKLVKVIIVIQMIVSVILAIGIIMAGFQQGTGLGILALILSPWSSSCT
jgi:hypothetical protein